ncbi:MAG: hypothetical protein IPL16_01120 [Ignavibacteria bacterium]|nr:hypothetical protein [Ignavibacteria bacterium]
MNEADLILYLTDSSEDEKSVKDDITDFENNFEKERSVLVFSKCDLKKISSDKGINISLLNEETLEKLKAIMSDRVKSSIIPFSKDEIVLTNIRHKFCLENVIRSLDDALKSVENKMSGEFISVDLRNALNHLGEITGEVTNDTILNNIFMNFCIGKIKLQVTVLIRNDGIDFFDIALEEITYKLTNYTFCRVIYKYTFTKY